MKYFIDTEFIEGFKKPLFGKKRHFIELISIGIVSEDHRQYYAINKDYNFNNANAWVKENVIRPLYINEVSGDRRNHMTIENFHKHTSRSKTVKQIATDIFNFINPDSGFHIGAYSNSEIDKPGSYLQHYFQDHNVTAVGEFYVAQPEFWGYYCDYDWVLFCSLFGTMMDLPKGFPMYCRDVKQLLDEIVDDMMGGIGTHDKGDKQYFAKKEDALQYILNHPDYPVNANEHISIFDAAHEYKLYQFLKKFVSDRYK